MKPRDDENLGMTPVQADDPQSDSWLLPYLDIFTLLTTLLVLLISITGGGVGLLDHLRSELKGNTTFDATLLVSEPEVDASFLNPLTLEDFQDFTIVRSVLDSESDGRPSVSIDLSHLIDQLPNIQAPNVQETELSHLASTLQGVGGWISIETQTEAAAAQSLAQALSTNGLIPCRIRVVTYLPGAGTAFASPALQLTVTSRPFNPQAAQRCLPIQPREGTE